MKHLILKLTGGLFLAAMLCAPALADATVQRGPANPGTVNYVEGQVSIGVTQLGATSEGTAMLAPGQTLATENGKAEILLTPGVFARVGDDSSIQMISPDLTKTELAVNRGEAMVEVAELYPQNDLLVKEDGATIQLQKTGLYDFDAAHDQFRVFDGQAVAETADHNVKVKGGHELNFDSSKLKALNFNKQTYEADDLYKWSSLRSAYLAEANIDQAPAYLAWNGWYGPGWFGSAWYWDPWFDCYTFIPDDGIFYSPFGWGFYSPFYAYEAPIYFGAHYPHHFALNAQEWGPGLHYSPALHGGGYADHFHPSSGSRGSFTGTARAFGGSHVGGFTGGGFRNGGFGGFGGGFHGGGGHPR
jgi:hypothetical protein